MTSLIAVISSGKGTWAHVMKIIEEQEWDSIYLISDEFGKENFKPPKPVAWITIDQNKFLPELVEELKQQLQDRITDTEVALNLISGNGKEHMAVLSAILKLGVGIRLIALTPDGVKEI